MLEHGPVEDGVDRVGVVGVPHNHSSAPSTVR
jgi:hypothetical protein